MVAARMISSDGVKICDIVSKIRSNFFVGITMSRVWKAKQIAKALIEDDAVKQYNLMWRYSAKLKIVNYGNTCKINLTRVGPTIQLRLNNFYFCLDGLKKDFTTSCRSFIGVDGCHLKTKFRGTLLITVGRDPNDQYYPIAFGVYETETKESCRWFLTLLLEDIGQEKGWVFISDQQKGLIPVFEELFERVEHRICLRHLYANFKKKFGGWKQINDLMMVVAKATYIQDWDAKMKELKELIVKAWEWLNANLRERVDRWNHRIMPRPRFRLGKEVEHAGNWIPNWSGDTLWQVEHTHIRNSFIVDTSKKTCTCNFWELVDIPCRHVFVALGFRNQSPEDFVDDYYSKDTYEKCYGYNVSPINGQDMCPEVDMEEMLPPSYKRGLERPKKMRTLIR
ncbi:hypothetical protein KIW84_063755 [Lathyrus oleraceus]|uniref:SWIM-type domain-containing protein n=1 Tax=Pisum sativum TaxID=3888 RepID=A0A9D4W8F9_PEA|nr:hypothetical protein KIW84_063755 [Pisum sativum]